MPDLSVPAAAIPFTVYQEMPTIRLKQLLTLTSCYRLPGGEKTDDDRASGGDPRPPPRRERQADWEIFAEVGRRLGFTEQLNFANAAEVYAEFVQLTHDRL